MTIEEILAGESKNVEFKEKQPKKKFELVSKVRNLKNEFDMLSAN